MNSINIFAVGALVNGVVSIIFGVIVLAKQWRAKMNQIFFLMTLALGVWSFAYWQWQLSTDYSTAMFWVKTLSVGSIFIPIFFYHWVTKLINIETIINKTILWTAYALSIAMLFFVNTDLFISGLSSRLYFLFWPNSGIIYDIYFSYLYLGLIIYTLYLLLRAYPLAEDVDKKGQILYIILGCVLGFGGGLTNFPLWWNINIPPFGNFLVAAFPFLLGYSVLKYKLFNIRTIISELMVFSLLIFMLIIVLLTDNWTARIVYIFFFILMGVVGTILVKSSYTIEDKNRSLQNLIKQRESLVHLVTHKVKGSFTRSKYIFAGILDGTLGEVNKEIKNWAQQGLDSDNMGIETVDLVLNADNLQKGAVKYDMQKINFKEIVLKTIEEKRGPIEAKGLKLEIEIKDDTYNILGDAFWLKETVNNLIENSFKYTKEGKITIGLKDGDGKINLYVKDTGLGITEEDKKNLFTEGGRGKDSVKVNVDSTGYGLYTVKLVIEAHKGRVWAESEGPNKGSTFFIELPTIS